MTPYLVGVISPELNQGGLFREAEPAESIAVEVSLVLSGFGANQKNKHTTKLESLPPAKPAN